MLGMSTFSAGDECTLALETNALNSAGDEHFGSLLKTCIYTQLATNDSLPNRIYVEMITIVIATTYLQNRRYHVEENLDISRYTSPSK